MDMNAARISAPWSIGADVLRGVNHKVMAAAMTRFQRNHSTRRHLIGEDFIDGVPGVADA